MTVLMRSLADNILVGLPQNLTILHVAQLQVFDEEMTVLKEVVSADRETCKLSVKQLVSCNTIDY